MVSAFPAQHMTPRRFSTLMLLRTMLISSRQANGYGQTLPMVQKHGAFPLTSAHWLIYERTGRSITIFLVYVLIVRRSLSPSNMVSCDRFEFDQSMLLGF